MTATRGWGGVRASNGESFDGVGYHEVGGLAGYESRGMGRSLEDESRKR